jgi:alkylation response protein AidB-like acyl-CoA dehydrogenase
VEALSKAGYLAAMIPEAFGGAGPKSVGRRRFAEALKRCGRSRLC